jgi:IclR family transcriptional regulator, acetate operon repressor
LNLPIRDKDRFVSLTPAVEQAAEVLKYLASESRFKTNLTDISKKLGINKSKAYAMLVALQHAGFVSKDTKTKLYSLGLDIIPIGQKALENVNYRKIARPFLEKLALDTKCTILFGLITGEKLLIISKEASGREIDSRLDIGYTLDVFFKSHGKVIIAALPEAEQEKLLSGENFFNDFEGGIIENSQLKPHIDEAKKKGFAMDTGRLSSIIKVLSSAVIAHDQCPIGAIIVMGLMNKSVVPKYGGKLVKAAKELSKALGASQ